MAHFGHHDKVSVIAHSKKTMENPSHTQGEKAFLAAYDQYADAIFRFLAMKISDREIARDLTQETFTRAWDFCVEGGEIREWKPFLYRTAYNLVVDSYRKKKSVSLDALIDDQGLAVPDESVSEKTTVMQAEMSRVRSAIGALDETYRDILILRYIDDLPPKDISRITGLSENVVSVRIHRGVEKLRVQMGPAKKTRI